MNIGDGEHTNSMNVGYSAILAMRAMITFFVGSIVEAPYNTGLAVMLTPIIGLLTFVALVARPNMEPLAWVGIFFALPTIGLGLAEPVHLVTSISWFAIAFGLMWAWTNYWSQIEP